MHISRCRIAGNFILSTFLALASLGCRPKCGENPPTYYVCKECKEYGYFLQGTYWVYQNDSTLQIDSIEVVSDTTGLTAEPNWSEECEENPYTSAYFEFTLSTTSANIFGESPEYGASYSGAVIREHSFAWSIFLDSLHRTNANPATWSVIGTSSLNGNTFNDIFEMLYPTVNYYDAKHIGIIKKEYFNDTSDYVESWSLLRYHIVQ